ncbi:hypothetical protein GQ53DRAFT_750360 [Thozetella sp. PMI_491]|nr:hypothetical protein GQ53DRAFT_750360 [Thozetella sp. PMI_491]
MRTGNVGISFAQRFLRQPEAGGCREPRPYEVASRLTSRDHSPPPPQGSLSRRLPNKPPSCPRRPQL